VYEKSPNRNEKTLCANLEFFLSKLLLGGASASYYYYYEKLVKKGAKKFLRTGTTQYMFINYIQQ
jgi:hypothetical protein